MKMILVLIVFLVGFSACKKNTKLAARYEMKDGKLVALDPLDLIEKELLDANGQGALVDSSKLNEKKDNNNKEGDSNLVVDSNSLLSNNSSSSTATKKSSEVSGSSSGSLHPSESSLSSESSSSNTEEEEEEEEEELVLSTYYLDDDGDGYGNPNISKEDYEQPTGYVEDKTDCDDENAKRNPGAYEICDTEGLDEDCDETTGNDQVAYYPDSDGDGFGDGSADPELTCEQPTGYTLNDKDCDDDDSDVNPNAIELCDDNDVDEDCSGYADDTNSLIDSEISEDDKSVFYVDNDSDGFGDPTEEVFFCPGNENESVVTDNTDCDDSDSGYSINTDATEICDDDDTDEDCSGYADDTNSLIDPEIEDEDKTAYYPDVDGDGNGDSSSDPTYSCEILDGYVDNSDDDYPSDANDDMDGDGIAACTLSDSECDEIIENGGSIDLFPENNSMASCDLTVGSGKDFETIDEAVDNASDDDFICVEAGIYTEEVTFTKTSTGELNLSLYCLDQDKNSSGEYPCIIDGDSSHRTLYIKGKNNTTITGETLIKGFTLRNGLTSGGGGGLYVEKAYPTFENIVISKNKTTDNLGGGLYLNTVGTSSSHMKMSSIDILSNSNISLEGGGIGIISSYVTLNSLVINSNYSSDSGGGLYSQDSDTTLINASIESNTSKRSGGGVEIVGSGKFYGKNIFIKSNESQNNNGGGLYVSVRSENNRDIELYNMTIVENKSKYAGGGILFSAYDIHIQNSIFYNNITTNADYWHDVAYNVSTSNTLLNSAFDCDKEKSRETGSSSKDICSLGNGSHLFSSNFDAECFNDPENGDYTLKADSACIDAGDDTGESDESHCEDQTDLLGNSRCSGDAIDIGAFEYTE